jgi:hypothetical protein
MNRLAWVLLAMGCQPRHEPPPSPGAQPGVTLATPSAVTLATPSAVTSAPSALSAVHSAPSAEAAGEPFEVRPTVVTKHTLTNGEFLGTIHAEPGVLLGPQKKLVKAFDCVSKGAPSASVIGVCVGFKSCVSATPSTADALAEIACSGPKLQLLLVRTETGLTFKVADSEHALAKRKMSEIVLPPGTHPQMGAFEQKNLSVNVDL